MKIPNIPKLDISDSEDTDSADQDYEKEAEQNFNEFQHENTFPSSSKSRGRVRSFSNAEKPKMAITPPLSSRSRGSSHSTKLNAKSTNFMLSMTPKPKKRAPPISSHKDIIYDNDDHFVLDGNGQRNKKRMSRTI